MGKRQEKEAAIRWHRSAGCCKVTLLNTLTRVRQPDEAVVAWVYREGNGLSEWKKSSEATRVAVKCQPQQSRLRTQALPTTPRWKRKRRVLSLSLGLVGSYVPSRRIKSSVGTRPTRFVHRTISVPRSMPEPGAKKAQEKF